MIACCLDSTLQSAVMLPVCIYCDIFLNRTGINQKRCNCRSLMAGSMILYIFFGNSLCEILLSYTPILSVFHDIRISTVRYDQLFCPLVNRGHLFLEKDVA